ncbi:MAG: hypothetical protein ACRCSU_02800, partial [Paracoccaceae bacterium]
MNDRVGLSRRQSPQTERNPAKRKTVFRIFSVDGPMQTGAQTGITKRTTKIECTMPVPPYLPPKGRSYDVVIVGGAAVG